MHIQQTMLFPWKFILKWKVRVPLRLSFSLAKQAASEPILTLDSLQKKGKRWSIDPFMLE